MERVSFDRNIVQYYGAWLEQDDAPFLVMEYMQVRFRTRARACGQRSCDHDISYV